MNQKFTSLKKNYTLAFSLFICMSLCLWRNSSYAQGIPPGSCGIAYTYDASGNQIARQYVCNNITAGSMSTTTKSEEVFLKLPAADTTTTTIIEAQVVYPNPTSGILNIKLYKPLENGTVSILDLSGKVVFKTSQKGGQLVLDLSSLQRGNYILRIEDSGGKTAITQNIIKL